MPRKRSGPGRPSWEELKEFDAIPPFAFIKPKGPLPKGLADGEYMVLPAEVAEGMDCGRYSAGEVLKRWAAAGYPTVKVRGGKRV